MVCGLAAGNSLGIKVLYHTLNRSYYEAGWRAEGKSPVALHVGSIAICDDCIRNYARPPRELDDPKAYGYKQPAWPDRPLPSRRKRRNTGGGLPG